MTLSELSIIDHSSRSIRSLLLSPAVVVSTAPDTTDDDDDDDDGDHGAGVAAGRVRINIISPGNSVGNSILF